MLRGWARILTNRGNIPHPSLSIYPSVCPVSCHSPPISLTGKLRQLEDDRLSLKVLKTARKAEIHVIKTTLEKAFPWIGLLLQTPGAVRLNQGHSLPVVRNLVSGVQAVLF